jgi:Flp pilus assembly pilin Flp
MNALNRTYVALATRLDALRRDQAGLSTVEYIIILILIAVVAIALWQTFGEAVGFRVRESTTSINGMPSSGGGGS